MNRHHATILDTLRHTDFARYSELLKRTPHESATFKFFIRNLCKSGHIRKRPDGLYELTSLGKVYANVIDDCHPEIRAQTKLSVLIITQRLTPNGTTEYLFHKRSRQPFMNYHGLVSGPVLWGEPAIEAAKRELRKQTGLLADFEVAAHIRVFDYETDSNQLLEDKLFAVVKAANVTGQLTNYERYGENSWMTLSELQSMKHFANTKKMIEFANSDPSYYEFSNSYIGSEY